MADKLTFDWNEANIEHIARHDVTPTEVEQFFENDPIDINFEVVNGENRWTALGHASSLHFLIVVYTLRDEAVRTVTVREASRNLRVRYLALKGVV